MSSYFIALLFSKLLLLFLSLNTSEFDHRCKLVLSECDCFAFLTLNSVFNFFLFFKSKIFSLLSRSAFPFFVQSNFFDYINSTIENTSYNLFVSPVRVVFKIGLTPGAPLKTKPLTVSAFVLFCKNCFLFY